MVLRPDVPRKSTLRPYSSPTHSVQGTASRFGVPPPDVKWLARWLQNNFINSYENLRRGRLYVQSRAYKYSDNKADAHSLVCTYAYALVSYSFFSYFLSPSWTLVTSTFSHAEPGHALLNGLTFWFLAPTALAALGNAQFLVLYLGSAFNFPTRRMILLSINQPPTPFFHWAGGAFASLTSLVWNKQRNYYSHGASGARSFFLPSLPYLY